MIRSAILMTLSLAALGSVARAGDFVSVCDRQKPFKDFLTAQLSKTCDQITAADLAPITRLAVPGSGLTAFKRSDVANLPNLEILNITRNPYTSLPDGAFDELPNLKTLVLFGTQLQALPNDFLEYNPLIENLHIFSNPFTTIPPVVLDRLLALQHIQVIDLADVLEAPVKDKLRAKYPDDGAVALTFY